MHDWLKEYFGEYVGHSFNRIIPMLPEYTQLPELRVVSGISTNRHTPGASQKKNDKYKPKSANMCEMSRGKNNKRKR